jgi:UDP-N-acetyl-D-mannosaminuronic acid dehydrogenase
MEAEVAKLFTNVWRYIQFAIANQFYQIATQFDLDFYKLYKAITYKYPRAESFPGAGFAAGPCLFKDTMQLAAFSNNSFFLGHAAMLINEGLPNFIVQRLKEKYDLKDKIVGILGMAFKANSDDIRESLSYKLRKLLEMEAKKVLCSDVYISERGFVSADDIISSSDLVILATPHREYADLYIDNRKILVDVWNFYGRGGLF